MFDVPTMTEPEIPADHDVRRPRLRVPREDETLYAVPPLENAERMARENRALLEEASVDIQGRPLAKLRAWSRSELCRAARDYTSTWCDVPGCDSSTELVYVTGHQPLLFHPGVWVKNFAVGNLARQPHAIGINLVVDNDTFSSAALRIPAGVREHPSVTMLDFDRGHPPRPWEGAEILDPAIFENFGARVSTAMAAWDTTPLIEDLWPIVVERARTSSGLADCFTAARNQLERRWGVENLELPLSRLCCLDPFLWFFSHLIAHLPRFREIYNQSLVEYRQINKVRSHTHPVPELRENDGWLEAPFWIWSDSDQERRRVFAQQQDREILLQDGETIFARLPLTPDSEACCAVEVLRQLPEQGLHLRTRALTTTLFTRLCLADLFLHGIGGAKYDEMTDRIITRFFGLQPPSFMTTSATTLLPLEAYRVQHSDLTRIDTLLRDLVYNPDRHLDEEDRAQYAGLLDEKRCLILEADEERNQRLSRRLRRAGRQRRFARFHRLREINALLQPAVERQREILSEEHAQLAKQLAANEVLASREFSFALYPEEKLKPFMLSAGTA